MFVYMKCRFSLSYRELEEMMQIRGAVVDHSTLQRWVQRFAKLISGRVPQRKKSVNGSWRMDETYINLGDRNGTQEKRKVNLVTLMMTDFSGLHIFD